MERSKKNITKVTEQVDMKTGELLGAQFTSVSYEREDDYIKIYIRRLLKLYDIPSTGVLIFICLFSRMGYTKETQNKIKIDKELKIQIAKELKIKPNTIEHYIIKLVKHNLLLKTSFRGTYMFNPYVVARGDWHEIKKVRMTVNFDIKKNNMDINSEFFTHEQTEINFDDFTTEDKNI